MIFCCICHFGLIEDVVSTTCGHLYHKACLKEWRTRSNDCPDCRMELTDLLVHPVFLKFIFDYSFDESADDFDCYGIGELFLDESEQNTLSKIRDDSSSLKVVLKHNQDAVINLKSQVDFLKEELNKKTFELLDLGEKLQDAKVNLQVANDNNISLIHNKTILENEIASLQIIIDNYLVGNPQ